MGMINTFVDKILPRILSSRFFNSKAAEALAHEEKALASVHDVLSASSKPPVAKPFSMSGTATATGQSTHIITEESMKTAQVLAAERKVIADALVAERATAEKSAAMMAQADTAIAKVQKDVLTKQGVLSESEKAVANALKDGTKLPPAKEKILRWDSPEPVNRSERQALLRGDKPLVQVGVPSNLPRGNSANSSRAFNAGAGVRDAELITPRASGAVADVSSAVAKRTGWWDKNWADRPLSRFDRGRLNASEGPARQVGSLPKVESRNNSQAFDAGRGVRADERVSPPVKPAAGDVPHIDSPSIAAEAGSGLGRKVRNMAIAGTAAVGGILGINYLNKSAEEAAGWKRAEQENAARNAERNAAAVAAAPPADANASIFFNNRATAQTPPPVAGAPAQTLPPLNGAPAQQAPAAAAAPPPAAAPAAGRPNVQANVSPVLPPPPAPVAAPTAAQQRDTAIGVMKAHTVAGNPSWLQASRVDSVVADGTKLMGGDPLTPGQMTLAISSPTMMAGLMALSVDEADAATKPSMTLTELSKMKVADLAKDTGIQTVAGNSGGKLTAEQVAKTLITSAQDKGRLASLGFTGDTTINSVIARSENAADIAAKGGDPKAIKEAFKKDPVQQAAAVQADKPVHQAALKQKNAPTMA